MARKPATRGTSPGIPPGVVPVVWKLDATLTTIYANHLYISRVGPEYYLSFGELVPPDITEGAALPRSVDVKQVVRIAVAPETLQLMAAAINSTIEKFATATSMAEEKGVQDVRNSIPSPN
jgi:hypothetical protein